MAIGVSKVGGLRALDYIPLPVGREVGLVDRAYSEPVSMVMILGDSERALRPMLPDTA